MELDLMNIVALVFTTIIGLFVRNVWNKVKNSASTEDIDDIKTKIDNAQKFDREEREKVWNLSRENEKNIAKIEGKISK